MMAMHESARPGDVVAATGHYLDSDGRLSYVREYDCAHARSVGHDGMHVWDGQTADGKSAQWQPDGNTIDRDRPSLIARVNTWYDAPIPDDVPPEALVEIVSSTDESELRRRLSAQQAGRKVYRKWRVVGSADTEPMDLSTGCGFSAPHTGSYTPGYAEVSPDFSARDPQPEAGETWLVDLPTSARGDLHEELIEAIDAQVVWFEAGTYARTYARDSVRFVRRMEDAPERPVVVRRGDRVRFEADGCTVEGRVSGVPTMTVSGTLDGCRALNRTADVTVVLDDAKAEETW